MTREICLRRLGYATRRQRSHGERSRLRRKQTLSGKPSLSQTLRDFIQTLERMGWQAASGDHRIDPLADSVPAMGKSSYYADLGEHFQFQEKERAMNSVASGSEMLTVREVSQILRIHPTTVYKLAREGKLPSFKVGANWRFHKDLIARWMVYGSEAVEMSEVSTPFSKLEHRTFERKPPARQEDVSHKNRRA